MSDPLRETFAEAMPREWWNDPAAALLDEVTHRPEWQVHAACRGRMVNGESLWFGKTFADRLAAREVCRSCPVRTECRDAGRTVHGEWGTEFGVWGGEGRGERGDRSP